jgi:hypothetical protein
LHISLYTTNNLLVLRSQGWEYIAKYQEKVDGSTQSEGSHISLYTTNYLLVLPSQGGRAYLAIYNGQFVDSSQSRRWISCYISRKSWWFYAVSEVAYIAIYNYVQRTIFCGSIQVEGISRCIPRKKLLVLRCCRVFGYINSVEKNLLILRSWRVFSRHITKNYRFIWSLKAGTYFAIKKISWFYAVEGYSRNIKRKTCRLYAVGGHYRYVNSEAVFLDHEDTLFGKTQCCTMHIQFVYAKYVRQAAHQHQECGRFSIY